jgi:hypothetical protein
MQNLHLEQGISFKPSRDGRSDITEANYQIQPTTRGTQTGVQDPRIESEQGQGPRHTQNPNPTSFLNFTTNEIMRDLGSRES